MSFAGFVPRAGAPAPASSAPALEGRYQAQQGPVEVALDGGPVWIAGQAAPDPARAVLEAYLAKGPDFLLTLTGRFALAIVDRSCDRVLLALDPMGIERVAYSVGPAGVAFGTSAYEVARRQPGAVRLRPQALFDYLLLHMVPSPDTAYAGVAKLRPGTAARVENGVLHIARFWSAPFVERGGESFETLRDGLYAALAGGVAACEPDAATGSFLSGGLDSSTVSGMLGQVSGRPPRTFSIGFGVDEFNELEYARISNRRFHAIAHEYNVTPDDIVDAFPRIAQAYDEPFGNSSAVPTYFCARLARENGVTHLLAGDGGDEIFGGNERYARQRVFEIYRSVPAALRRSLIEPLAGLIPPESPVMPLRKLRSYVDQARIPLPERLESWNFMYRNDLAAMLEPGFRAAIDPRAPLARMAEVYALCDSPSLLHRMLAYDWHYTLSDNDLRKVGTMCALAGVRVSYPMLDPRVIDLAARVPPRAKMRGYELRSFFRRAMQGFLPPEVLAKKKHGFGLPFGQWLKTHARLGELIYGLLGDLKRRRIVRADFLDDLVNQHRDGHASYFGYAIWDLAMLEAWLQAHPVSLEG